MSNIWGQGPKGWGYHSMSPKYQGVLMVMMFLSYFSSNRAWHTESHVTTKIFQIDGLPNFLKRGAPLARLQRYVKTELKANQMKIANKDNKTEQQIHTR